MTINGGITYIRDLEIWQAVKKVVCIPTSKASGLPRGFKDIQVP